MANYLRIDRVVRAVTALNNWQGSVRKQSTAHVLPLLALLEKGGNKSGWIAFEESDDFLFFDRYCRVSGTADTPYFDPFNRSFRIASHPHSNIATARKGTFANSWKAAELQQDPVKGALWKLAEKYAEITSEKLQRGGTLNRINVLDIAVWLFRGDAFPDGSTSETLLEKFRATFPMDQADYDQLFEYIPESPTDLFQDTAVADADISTAISALALGSAAAVVKSSTQAVPAVARVSTRLLIKEDDGILEEVKLLLQVGTSGIIFRGTPGTGKSWYANQIAMSLAEGDEARILRTQFHPSYTYEDFVDGFAPTEDSKSGFRVVGKVLRQACDLASASSAPVVLIVDEINRGNTAKIFGETLTYIEHGWRGVEFRPRLSESKLSIPANLVFLGTMNPYDRSISSLDMALLRRFDHIDIPPDSDQVAAFLALAGMAQAGVPIICHWFESLQKLLPHGLGHAFFKGVNSSSQLALLWRYRIQPFCRSLLEYDEVRLRGVEDSYKAMSDQLRQAGC